MARNADGIQVSFHGLQVWVTVPAFEPLVTGLTNPGLVLVLVDQQAYQQGQADPTYNE